jgi:hypothetical protein
MDAVKCDTIAKLVNERIKPNYGWGASPEDKTEENERSAKKLRESFGMLVEMLAKSGALSARDTAAIIRGHRFSDDEESDANYEFRK